MRELQGRNDSNRCTSLGLMPSAHKVNDFQLVSVAQCRLWPGVAGNDLAVQLDGDAIGLHAKLFHQRGKGSDFELPLFTVNN